MSRLRIAMVTRRYWPLVGGTATALASLATTFRQCGHETTVVTAQWESEWPTEVVHRDVPVVRLPQPELRGWGTIRYLYALSRWLRAHRHEFDAVLVSELRHDAYATLAALRDCQMPVILRAHGIGAGGDCAWQRTSRFGGRIAKTCAQAAAIIAPSGVIMDELLAAGYSRTRIHEVPNGVLVPALGDADSKWHARSAVSDANMALEMVIDAPLVAYCGRLSSAAGLDVLVKAWEKIAQRRPNARLWLLGEGPEREPLYDLIVDLGLHHQVFLPGAFDDAAEIIAAADVLVYPAPAAGLSLAVLEAMAAGVPVVASDCPGQRQCIDSEQQGLLVPAGDHVALRTAIERLLADPAFAVRLGQQARERVVAEFTLDRMAQGYLAVIQQALDWRGP